MSKKRVALYQNEPRVYQVLRDSSDTPILELDSGDDLVRPRHDERKEVLLACTPFYCYLFKKKHFKLYGRWPLSGIQVVNVDRKLVIHLDDELALVEQNLHRNEVGKTDDDGNIIFDPRRIELEGTSRSTVEDLSFEISELIKKAKDIQAKERAVPEMPSRSRRRKRRGSGSLFDQALETSRDGAESEEISSSESESESSDDGGGASGAAHGAAGKKRMGAAGRASKLAQDTQRYVAISSLVDGEFADYQAVREAYSTGNSKKLLGDLESFIADNQRHIQDLCHRYYSRFLHAGDECAQIDETEVSKLQTQLQHSTRGIQDAGYKLRSAGTQLKEATIVEERLKMTQHLMARMKRPVQLLATAEDQFHRNQLLNAVTTLSLVEEATVPLVETSLGQFILHERIPSLTAEILALGVQQMKEWCRVLRDNATVIGKAAMSSGGGAGQSAFGPKDGGSEGSGSAAESPSVPTSSGNKFGHEQTKTIEVLPNGRWTVVVDTSNTLPPDFLYSIQTGGPFASVVSQVTEVSAGAGVQALMNGCGCESSEAFVQNVRLSRDMQLSLELDNRKISLEELCERTLGFMIVEDVVFHVTSPPVTTESILHQQWARIVAEVATRASMTSTGEVAAAKRTLAIVKRFVEQAAVCVHCVQLSPGILHTATDHLRDILQATLMSNAAAKLSDICLSDQLRCITVATERDFTTDCSRLNLHRAPHLLSVPAPPTGSGASKHTILPYSAMIPAIGYTLLDFVSECYSVVSCSGPAELNNIDPMVLNYLGSLVKTCTDLLMGRVQMLGPTDTFHYATICSNVNAFLVVLSTVEQRYVQCWDGVLKGEYSFGEPALLLDATKNLKRVTDQALGKAIDSVILTLRQMVQPGGDPKYWAYLPENDVSVIGFACEYLVGTLPTLQAVWTPIQIHSLTTSVLFQLSELFVDVIETAITRSFGSDQPEDGGFALGHGGGTEAGFHELASEKDVRMLSEALANYETRAHGPIVQGLVDKLNTLMRQVVIQHKTSTATLGGGGADEGEDLSVLTHLRFSFEPGPLCTRLRHWIEKKEVEVAQEAARQLQIAADLQAAGQAVVTGVKDAGKATTKGVRWFGRGIKKAAAVTAFARGKGGAGGGGHADPSDQEPPDQHH